MLLEARFMVEDVTYLCNSSYNCTPFLHSLLTKGKVGAVQG